MTAVDNAALRALAESAARPYRLSEQQERRLTRHEKALVAAKDRSVQALARAVLAVLDENKALREALSALQAYAIANVHSGGAHHHPVWAQVADALEPRA